MHNGTPATFGVPAARSTSTAEAALDRALADDTKFTSPAPAGAQALPDPESDYQTDEDDAVFRGSKRKRPVSVSCVPSSSYPSLPCRVVGKQTGKRPLC